MKNMIIKKNKLLKKILFYKIKMKVKLLDNFRVRFNTS